MRQARPIILPRLLWMLPISLPASHLPRLTSPQLKTRHALLHRSRSSRQPRVQVLASTLQRMAVGSAIFATMRMTRLQINDGDSTAEDGRAGPLSTAWEQQSLQLLHNPLRRLAIPFGRNRPFLPLPGHQSRQRGWKLAWISPDQFIGANREGFRPLGVVTQGEARCRKPIQERPVQHLDFPTIRMVRRVLWRVGGQWKSAPLLRVPGGIA